MIKKQFFELLESQEFSQAVEIFERLDYAEKKLVFQQLYAQRQIPNFVSILYRHLHDDKNFDDFYQAWLPPKDAKQPFEIPVRVFNAINVEDQREIVSLGFIWGTPEELKAFYEALPQDKTNQIRHDAIAKVADKISSKIYFIKSDSILGGGVKLNEQ